MQEKSFASLKVEYNEQNKEKWDAVKATLEYINKLFAGITRNANNIELTVGINIKGTPKHLCIHSVSGKVYIGLYEGKEQFDFTLGLSDLERITLADLKLLEYRAENIRDSYMNGKQIPTVWSKLDPLWNQVIPILDQNREAEKIYYNGALSSDSIQVQDKKPIYPIHRGR